MSELKKCPFCGGEAELNWHGWIGVDCTGCTCSLGDDGEFQTEKQAIAAWNRRADHSGEENGMVSNADRIRSMSDEELAELLSQVAYARHTPWSEPFHKLFYACCPTETVEPEGYHQALDLHECDFTDGTCPHGSDIVWWLRQPAKEEAE